MEKLGDEIAEMSRAPEGARLEQFDCLSCGACCRDGADGAILVSDEDVERWKAEGATRILASLVPGHFSQMGFATHPNGACVHLGTPANPNACSIYETRGWCCHALAPGSSQCRTFRKLAGKIDEP